MSNRLKLLHVDDGDGYDSRNIWVKNILSKPKFEELPVPEIVDIKHVRLEKDGTRYEVMAFKFDSDIGFGCLGALQKGGWLVIEGLNRKAYLFHETYIESGYLWSKLCRAGFNLSTKDAENIQSILAHMGIHKP